MSVIHVYCCGSSTSTSPEQSSITSPISSELDEDEENSVATSNDTNPPVTGTISPPVGAVSISSNGGTPTKMSEQSDNNISMCDL